MNETPARFEDFADAWQDANDKYQTYGRGYYRELQRGEDAEDLKELKDLARIELESVGQEILRAIERERREIRTRQSRPTEPLVGPTVEDLAEKVSRNIQQYAIDRNRLRKLEDLEAFLNEHGIVRVPDE